MTLTISKCKLSKQQHTITLDYTLGENEKNSLIFTLMICRNFFAHRNAVCKTRDGLAHLIKLLQKKDTNRGFIFEVDLDYPESLWDSNNDYPLAPDKVKGNDKLICSLLPKRNCVLHYKNLKQYLQEGMILKKVHQGIKFYHSPWMEPYIRKNTDLRKLATSSFEKDFFKLMNNSVFGKTIEKYKKTAKC